jgi:hypothetical protein
MPSMLDRFHFLLAAVAGWINQRQQQVIEYLREENRVLGEQLGDRRIAQSAVSDYTLSAGWIWATTDSFSCSDPD